MTVKNNWISTSMKERTAENLCDFTVTVNPYKFEMDSFHNNAVRVAKELCDVHNNLYIMYSGGLDSEYVVKVFAENNLPFTPLIVVTPFNVAELMYTVKFLRKYNLKPHVINYQREPFLEMSRQTILDKGYRGSMMAMIHDVCDKVADLGGNVITGNGEPMHPRPGSVLDDLVNICEFGFYVQNHPGDHIGGFYTYDIALNYSFADEIRIDIDKQTAKSLLYGLEHRPKMYWEKEYYQFLNILNARKGKQFGYEIYVPRKQYMESLLKDTPTTFSHPTPTFP